MALRRSPGWDAADVALTTPEADVEPNRRMRTEETGTRRRHPARVAAVLAVTALVMVGAGLRLYLIQDQILLDDEWHGLIYAPSHSVSELLVRPIGAANCAPLNAWYRLLLDTVGWTEMTLRLPSLLPGLAALVLFPVLVWSAYGAFTSGIFTMLLALSPMLVFYSRDCRQYALLVLLLVVALHHGLRWLKFPARSGAPYVVASTLALYVHPVALLTVLMPVAIGIGSNALSGRLPWATAVAPGVGRLVTVAVLILSAAAVTIDVPLIAEVRDGPGSSLSAETVVEFLRLLFGTSRLSVALVLLLLAAIGALELIRRAPLCGLLLAAVFAGNVLAIGFSRLASISAALVFARYVIVVFPISFLWVAIGLETALAALPAGSVALLATRVGLSSLLLGVLCGTSPLWTTYAAPNNFTNHSAFQESYRSGRPLDPYHTAVTPRFLATQPPRMSPFYDRLPATVQTIIEFPLPIADHWNLYYSYQRRHRRRVVGGFAAESPAPPRFDQMISFLAAHPRDRLRFRNLVDVMDPMAVRSSGADLLIVHSNLIDEFLPERKWVSQCCAVEVTRTPDLEDTLRSLTDEYGPPVHADDTIVAFEVSLAGSASDQRRGRVAMFGESVCRRRPCAR